MYFRAFGGCTQVAFQEFSSSLQPRLRSEPLGGGLKQPNLPCGACDPDLAHLVRPGFFSRQTDKCLGFYGIKLRFGEPPNLVLETVNRLARILRTDQLRIHGQIALFMNRIPRSGISMSQFEEMCDTVRKFVSTVSVPAETNRLETI
jgi:hypothetical protein